ncbi:Two-component response regulator, YesN/AraC family, consists of REC and AraC-type DNA-binding domains [Peptoclostridium litorale DSM 5388]|uniref:Stage 0 sporulation protein A homolog n=1 Tax=Peptoclostridium litorale DSM 5388 TaxID=1121324 RepID=A0A069RHQ4_PEPLI|nr:response regulator [Peptoclostridium litorale]KDR96328.1 response regulator receiver domain-containing protein [Peptoclostridium litorale DSM 5388]SIO26456.1 Two-component response regulator, YesN/AraC family, consists of REC and AraC-type DNA-binding domains [Peptoclostridium litorale DSM 5388]
MYKVLIVDDEVLVRVGLKTTIDWQAIGFTVVAEASNGEQGFEQYKKHYPDVIITDIKMPKKDGFWLIEQVRKKNKNVKILVLTCYDDFDSAREALRIGADDYILKFEVEDEELISVMKSMKSRIEEQSSAAIQQEIVKMNINDMKKVLLGDMIGNGFKLDDKTIGRCSEAGFGIHDTRFVFASISIQDDGLQGNGERPGQRKINDAMAGIIFEKLSDSGIEYIYSNEINKYTLLVSSPKISMVEINRIIASIRNASNQYFDISLSVVYTDPFDSLEEAGEAYENFIQKEQILFYESEKSFFIVNTSNISFCEADVFHLKKEYNNVFIEYMGQEKLKKLGELILHMNGQFNSKMIKPAVVKIWYSGLVGDIFKNYGQLFSQSEKIMHYEHYHYEIINSKKLESIAELALKFMEDVLGEIKISRYKNSKWIISKALYFIENNYEQKISLEDVACELSLSKHYLCNVFKREIGENMSLYINKLRIEKAKQLLLKTDFKIKEIFEDVGFTNQQYFSKVFKKITGMTISQYREKARMKSE